MQDTTWLPLGGEHEIEYIKLGGWKSDSDIKEINTFACILAMVKNKRQWL